MKRIPLSVIAEKIRKITDEGEYYVSDTVDGALQEVGKSIGDFDKALDELHTYAQALIAGGASV